MSVQKSAGSWFSITRTAQDFDTTQEIRGKTRINLVAVLFCELISERGTAMKVSTALEGPPIRLSKFKYI